jgi:hypothetical protein
LAMMRAKGMLPSKKPKTVNNSMVKVPPLASGFIN